MEKDDLFFHVDSDMKLISIEKLMNVEKNETICVYIFKNSGEFWDYEPVQWHLTNGKLHWANRYLIPMDKDLLMFYK